MELELGPIPLYWRKKSSPAAANAFPNSYPFTFSYNEDTGLISQSVTAKLRNLLNEIYRADSNIGYLQEGSGLAQPYGDDFFRFIVESLSTMKGSSPLRSLEVGCGGCWMLRKLREAGHEVCGVDPSPLASLSAAKFNLKVISGFFPAQGPEEPVDLIFHKDVLEHIEDPISFLRSHRHHLVDRGWIIVSVPDCSNSISAGDLGMVIHQHISFFDETSLRNVFQAAGFELCTLQKARYGGSFYCLARKTDLRTHNLMPPAQQKFLDFEAKVTHSVLAFQKFFDGTFDRSLGIYCPLRALAYFGISKIDRGIRLFDDDASLVGAYLDGFGEIVEPHSDFISKPPDKVLIMSLTFGEDIRQKLEASAHKDTEIFTFRDLLLDG